MVPESKPILIYIYIIQILSVCVCVCLSSIGGQTTRTDHDQIWHAYVDRPGDGSYLKKIDPPPKGVEVGILGGQENQKSGKCDELSRKSIKKMLTHPTPGGPGGQNFKSSGNFTNCRENR